MNSLRFPHNGPGGDFPIANNNDQPKYWTRKEIASEYRVHPNTVTRWDDAGLLPPQAKKFGARLWNRLEVIEWLAGRGLLPGE
jgi:hypothetical protein